jgi:hypothetical protein
MTVSIFNRSYLNAGSYLNANAKPFTPYAHTPYRPAFDYEKLYYEFNTLCHSEALELAYINQAEKMLTQFERDRNVAYYLPTIIEEDGEDALVTPSLAEKIISQSQVRLYYIRLEKERLLHIKYLADIDAVVKRFEHKW